MLHRVDPVLPLGSYLWMCAGFATGCLNPNPTVYMACKPLGDIEPLVILSQILEFHRVAVLLIVEVFAV
jgi:hypothetical protein